MGIDVKQAQRLFHIDSPLGGDTFIMRSFEGSEGLSELFSFKLKLASEQFDIDFNDVVDKRINVGIRQADGFTMRNFNGFVKSFRQDPSPGRLAFYHAEVVPWLWYLTLSSDCRLWQHKTVPEIIRDVFDKLGFRDYEFKLVMTHTAWEYCTQYRETAFNFVSRIMEIEGMYYYFRHEDNKHTMVIVDHRSSHQPCPYQSTFRYDKVSGGGYRHDEDSIGQWIPQKSIRTARWTHKDYNFLIPQDPLLAGMDTTIDESPQEFELYEFPGDYEERMDANEWARLRIEEQEFSHETAEGGSNARSLASGYTFQLTNQDRPDQNREYLITHVDHKGDEGTLVGGTDSGEAWYENTFSAMPSAQQYRTGRKTKRAKMRGSQTGFVVGPPGEEIHTDEWGRIRVKWHWDRTDAQGDDCSCWMRVVQHWSDNRWGYQWIPRIGQEVIIDFLEGDPDRPIVTGCVYNAKNRFPYKLPDKKTVSGIKSNSTPGGGGYNEIRFDDQKNSELFAMHSQKDKQELILHDHVKQVQNDEDLSVDHDRKRKVGGDEDITVDGDRRVTIGKDLHLIVKGDVLIKWKGDYDFTLDGDRNEKVSGDQNLKLDGDQSESVGGDYDRSVQGDLKEKISGDRSQTISGDTNEQVQGSFNITVGESNSISAGESVTIFAPMITLSAGASFITISDEGVTIMGPMVMINSGGAPGTPTPAMPDPPKDPSDAKDPKEARKPKTPTAFTQDNFGDYTDTVQDPSGADSNQYDSDENTEQQESESQLEGDDNSSNNGNGAGDAGNSQEAADDSSNDNSNSSPAAIAGLAGKSSQTAKKQKDKSKGAGNAGGAKGAANKSADAATGAANAVNAAESGLDKVENDAKAVEKDAETAAQDAKGLAKDANTVRDDASQLKKDANKGVDDLKQGNLSGAEDAADDVEKDAGKLEDDASKTVDDAKQAVKDASKTVQDAQKTVNDAEDAAKQQLQNAAQGLGDLASGILQPLKDVPSGGSSPFLNNSAADEEGQSN